MLELRWFFPWLAFFHVRNGVIPLWATTLQPCDYVLVWTNGITKFTQYPCLAVVKCQYKMSEESLKRSLLVGLSGTCYFDASMWKDGEVLFLRSVLVITTRGQRRHYCLFALWASQPAAHLRRYLDAPSLGGSTSQLSRGRARLRAVWGYVWVDGVCWQRRTFCFILRVWSERGGRWLDRCSSPTYVNYLNIILNVSCIFVCFAGWQKIASILFPFSPLWIYLERIK